MNEFLKEIDQDINLTELLHLKHVLITIYGLECKIDLYDNLIVKLPTLHGNFTVFLEGGKLIIDETFTHLDSKDIIYITELINKNQLSLLNKIKAFYRAVGSYGNLEDSDAIEKTVNSILEEF